MAPGWWGELSKRPALVAAMVVAALGLVGVVGPQVREWLPRPAPRPTPPTAAVVVSPGFADVAVPVPSPTPVPLPDLGPPPPGIPLIWIGGPSGLVAYSWQGKALGVRHANTAEPSPDGQVFWNGESLIGARGENLGQPNLPRGSTVWSAGSDGLCGVASGGPTATVWTYRLGQPGSTAVRALPASVGGSVGEVAGCSFQRDLTLVTVGGSSVADLYWIRLHDGAVLGHKSYAPDAVAGVIASPDLRYFAENYVEGPHPGNQTEVTAIRRVSDGSLVASRDDSVEAFSADGTEIVTGAFNAGTVGVFNLTGRQLWAPSNGPADWAVAAPSGAAFAMTAFGSDGQPNVLQLVVNGVALPPISIPDGAHLLT